MSDELTAAAVDNLREHLANVGVGLTEVQLEEDDRRTLISLAEQVERLADYLEALVGILPGVALLASGVGPSEAVQLGQEFEDADAAQRARDRLEDRS